MKMRYLRYSTAIEYNPYNEDYFIDRSECYVSLNDNNNALIDLSKAIDLSEYPYYYTKRGEFYQDINEYEKAIDDFDMAISISPKYIWPMYLKGIILIELNKYDEATELFKQIIENDPEYYWAYMSLGHLSYLSKDYSESIKMYQKSLEIEENINSKIEISKNYLALKDTTAAIKITDALLFNSNIDSLTIYNSRFNFYVEYLKDYDKSLLEINNIILMNPSSESYAKRGMVYSMKNDFELALLDFEKSIELDPKNRSPYYNRSKMYGIKKDIEKQRNDLLTTIEMDPNDPEGYYYLALTYFDTQNHFQCLHYLDESIEKLEANLGYYISDESGFSKIKIYELYQKKAEVYKINNVKDLACKEYKNACENGNCEYYNSYCK